MRLPFLLLMLTWALTMSAQTGAQPSWQAPADAAARPNPIATKPELSAGGKKIFTRSCSQCHGTGTGATRNNAPVLSSERVQQDTDGTLFWKISNGNSRTGMPSFSSLPETQRWQLVLYIRSLAQPGDQKK
jgi:mono/diheme cytochrome c family protein